MAERQKGMGRGLAAILSVAPKDDAEEMRQLPVDLITPNPRQPRGSFDEETLVALAESIRARGVLQPVLVRPLVGGRYELVAGERRWRAAQLAELDTVPAIVRRHDDSESLEVALIENMARENLNPIEETHACAALIEELSLTREEINTHINHNHITISNLIHLLDLPDEALALIERSELTEGHGRALLLAEDHAVRRTLAREAAAAGWSVRDLENRARAAGTGDRGSAKQASRARRRRNLHPDQEAAITQISDALGEALGCDVDVAPSGRGYRAELSFASLDDALDMARRLRVRAAA